MSVPSNFEKPKRTVFDLHYLYGAGETASLSRSVTAFTQSIQIDRPEQTVQTQIRLEWTFYKFKEKYCKNIRCLTVRTNMVT